MLKIVKVILLIAVLSASFYFGCPFLKLTGLPCPACGITRAWLSLFQGEIKAAFEFNPVFIPLSLAFAWVVICEIISHKPKKAEIAVICTIGAAAFILNIFRIINLL